MPDQPKLSPAEDVKRQSSYLRGTIAHELAAESESFGKASVQLLKHHGTYQQDDRDQRTAPADGKGKSKKAYSMMVRSKIPGGKLTSGQLLTELDLCDELGSSTLRVTSRQGLQLHGILKRDLRETIHRINQAQLTTLGACGDVNRNVMCCPAPHNHDPVHEQMQQLADRLADHLAPRTRAYREIWITDPETGEESLADGNGSQDVEPIYGANYLPRKFKIAIGLPGDNCVDMYANDLAFMAIAEDSRIVGYNVLVGGGMGVTPSAEKTFPAVAKRMAFVLPDDAVDVATAVVKVQRDFGNRADRKIARMKYLIADRGLDWFRAKVEEYAGRRLAEPRPDDVWGFDDHIGWREQGDGRLFLGVNVENGRIKDEGPLLLKSALRKLCREFRPGIRLTSHQSILLTDIAPADRGAVEALLKAHGVKLEHEISQVRRWSMACVAWPTCGLSITEAERSLPGIIDQLEIELAKLGLPAERFTLRMTGCPNGCARPYNCDVGLVGRTAGKYTLFLGGRLLGDRLNFIYKDLVPEEQVVATLVPVLAYFRHAREDGETLGDFCARKGRDELLAWSEQFAAV